MRNVEHDAGHCRAQSVENRIKGLGTEIIDLFECRRCRQQAGMIGTLRKQAIDKGGGQYDPVRTPHRRSSRRILIVVEASGAECEIEVGDHRGPRQGSRAIAQATLWAIVDEPTPPLAPTTAMMRPTAFASGTEKRPQTEHATSSGATGAMT